MWAAKDGEQGIPVCRDEVHYRLYALEKRSENDYKILLENIHAITKEIPHFSDYVWQVEPFELAYCSEGVPHLRGRTQFGDNIDDEWFIVSILYEISRRLQDLAIAVFDNDGEFLLIEAANAIPRWLKPETSKFRVWIKGGALHIVPVPRNSAEMKLLPTGRSFTLSAALNALATQPISTIASKSVQEILDARIDNARQAAVNAKHFARVVIPASLAFLLFENPALISNAVLAYYHRDPLQMRACKAMAVFSAENAKTRTVRFTRCLYAQLLSQPLDFVPNSYAPIPDGIGQKEKQALELGYKLACGMEIARKEAEKSDVKLMGTIDEALERGRKGGFAVSEEAAEINESDDAWLNISPEEIEDILAQKQAELEMKSDVKPEGLFDEIIASTKAFVTQKSDYRGVIVDKADEADDEESEEVEEETKEGEKGEKKVDEGDEGDLEFNLQNEVRAAARNKGDSSDEEMDDEAFLKYFEERFGSKLYGNGRGEESESDEDDAFYEGSSEGDDMDVQDDDERYSIYSGNKLPFSPAIDSCDSRSSLSSLNEMASALRSVMGDMDAELSTTDVGRSFLSSDGNAADLDENLLRNFLQSFESQGGESGPVSNLMNALLQVRGTK